MKSGAPGTAAAPASSRPARGEWIEKRKTNTSGVTGVRLPARGEWIEKSSARMGVMPVDVSPRKGRVD